MRLVERAVVRIGRRQDNVVTLEQLLEAGLGRGAIEHRVEMGMMQRLHRGVYLLGAAPPTRMARVRAAVMACGEGAVLSHRSAAELYGLLPDAGGGVDVTVVGRNPGAEPGIRLHRPRQLARVDAVTMRGVPIPTVARTICDMAATETRRDVEHAHQEALYRRIVTDRQMAAVVTREPNRRGAPVIRALLDDPGMTRSERSGRCGS
jgi:predicted transcriptional regulator of viral defense system